MTRRFRVAWTVATLVVVETVVCGLAILPAVAGWRLIVALTRAAPAWRLVLVSFAAVPSYVLVALALLPLSAAATRITGWRTRPGLALRIADYEWPLLDWARYAAMNHLVRLIAGGLFRGSPIWTWYMRLNGARIGRRVYVNSLGVVDHDLLELGDGVVIGADAHVSGHTVEGGVVKTAHVRLGGGVTVGIGAIVEIDVEAGAGCQIGALAFVPKHSRLEAHGVYAGVPARRIE